MPISIFGNRTLEKLYLKDRSAVAVMKETEVVGDVPYNISSSLCFCDESVIKGLR